VQKTLSGFALRIESARPFSEGYVNFVTASCSAWHAETCGCSARLCGKSLSPS
jgi:hypothetical protein